MAITSTSSISSPGIGSGLDVTGLVNSLMNAESIPLTTLNKQKASNQAKISAFGTVKSNLAQFQTSLKTLSDPLQLQSLKATSSDTTVLTATSSTGASVGSYDIDVWQLAQNQKLAADGQTDLYASIGTGVISFDFGTISGGTRSLGHYSNANFQSNGSGIKTVSIDTAHSSLTGIRDAINAAGIGVTASIINDGSTTPYRLTLTNNATGQDQSMKISVGSNTGGLSDLISFDPTGNQKLTETLAAKNARLTIDGISISKSTNTISDAISGVTLNLLKTSATEQTTSSSSSSSGSSGNDENWDDSTHSYHHGVPFSSGTSGGSGSTTTTTTSSTSVSHVKVNVARDSQTLSTNIKSFTDAYNKLTSNLKSLTTYDQKTHTGAALFGESSVRGMLTNLRGIVTSALPDGSNGLTHLYEVGIEFQKDGTLSLNQSKLDAAINKNFDQFAGLFATNGVPSDSGISYLTGNSKTQTGNYAINVSHIATQGTLSGTTSITSSHAITVDDNNKSLTINLNGVTASIDVPTGSYTSASSLASAIQAQINGVASYSNSGAKVNFSVSGNTVSFSSSRYGSDSQIQITDPDGSNTMLTALLGNSPNSTTGTNVAGTINGVSATGYAQTLTGATDNASEGLRVKVLAGSTGNRGYLNYTRGFAYQLDQMTSGFLDNNGVIATRTNGINTTLKNLDNKITHLQDRLEILRQQYTKQFNTLDQTMSQMNSTQSYLTQQLAGLAKSSS